MATTIRDACSATTRSSFTKSVNDDVDGEASVGRCNAPIVACKTTRALSLCSAKGRTKLWKLGASKHLGCDKLSALAPRKKESQARRLTVTCAGQSVSGRFEELRKKGEIALIPFIVAGDPDLATTKEALLTLDASGADIIELGVPYSDPLADGPVIQAAAARALAKGTDLDSVLHMLAEVSPRLSAPIVLFTYYNPIMKKGGDNFMRAAKEAGAAALVVPDLPLEETQQVRDFAAPYGLEMVLLTTPTTPVDRMARICEKSEGFVYLVSLTGVTGARVSMEGRVEGLIAQLKAATTKPVAVGFGISGEEQAKQVVRWGADGVIVGSQIVRLLMESGSSKEGLEAIKALSSNIKKAVALEKAATPA